MPNKPGVQCSVCAHPQVDKINELLVNNVSYNGIVTRYPTLSRMSICRHKTAHLSEMLIRAQAAKETSQTAQVDNLFSQVRTLQIKALGILQQAETMGDLKTAVSAIREARACLELLGKVSGELQPEKIMIQLEPTINQIILIMRQEVRDPAVLQRISQRLLAEGNQFSGQSTDQS